MKKTLRISFNGKSYEVVAEILGEDGSAAARPAAASYASASAAAAPVAVASAPASSSAPRASGGAGEIPSPLAGKVVSIDAPVGTSVKAGQTVITLEAMKMNTVISAPIDGSVAAVHVAAGDSVEEGRLLMTLR